MTNGDGLIALRLLAPAHGPWARCDELGTCGRRKSRSHGIPGEQWVRRASAEVMCSAKATYLAHFRREGKIAIGACSMGPRERAHQPLVEGRSWAGG